MRKLVLFLVLCLLLGIGTEATEAQAFGVWGYGTNDEEDQSLSDAMRNYQKETNPEEKSMQQAQKELVSPIGTITSVIIYILFALTGLQTAVDFIYIGVPFTQGFLYGGQQGGQSGVVPHSQGGTPHQGTGNFGMNTTYTNSHPNGTLMGGKGGDRQ